MIGRELKNKLSEMASKFPVVTVVVFLYSNPRGLRES